MHSLTIDHLATANPWTNPSDRHNKTSQDEIAGIPLCLSCTLPDCIPYHQECLIRRGPGMTGVAGYTTKQARQVATDQHGADILAWFRAHPGGGTCPQIAHDLSANEGDIYTAEAALIIRDHHPIRPVGSLDRAAIYRLEATQ